MTKIFYVQILELNRLVKVGLGNPQFFFPRGTIGFEHRGSPEAKIGKKTTKEKCFATKTYCCGAFKFGKN